MMDESGGFQGESHRMVDILFSHWYNLLYVGHKDEDVERETKGMGI